jgi:hypothetical protein
MTNEKNQQGGKLVPFSLRERLHELRGVELHVWLAYFLHSNRDRIAWPSLETLKKETGYHEDIVSGARNRLRRKGWLSKVSENQPRQKGGRFAAPRMEVRIPSRTDKTSAPIKHRPGETSPDRTDVLWPDRTDETSVRRDTEKSLQRRDIPPSAKAPSEGSSSEKKENTRAEGDGRYQAVIEFYCAEFKRRHSGTQAPLGGSDGKALKNLLGQQPKESAKNIIGWLQSAFDSTVQYPLQGGFRLREFCSHYGKYLSGPLHRHSAEKETEDHGNYPTIEDARPKIRIRSRPVEVPDIRHPKDPY